jgi:hypothetical protein
MSDQVPPRVSGQWFMSAKLIGHVLPVAIAAFFITGCAYDPAKRDNNWAYSGPEQIHVPMPEALEAAKDTCARETAETKTPGYWAGYGSKFIACMNAHGWIRASSPL